MKSIQTNNYILIHTRRRALKCYIEPILMYGCEAWTISKELQKKTGDNKNVVPTENVMNLMDRKEIIRDVLQDTAR